MPPSLPGPAAGGAGAADSWRRHLLDDGAAIRALLQRVRRIAVLGIKTADGFPPAHYVPAAAQQAGYEVIPVPVYYPDVTEILGQPVYRRVADIPGPVDLVDVFRRPQDLPAHLDDLLAARPGAVWLQSGIRHAEVAETLARAGIDVVQDRCLMVEIQRAGR
jgi:predicted CoA-binding protein